MINTILTNKDFYDGAEFVCVYVSASYGNARPNRYVVGNTYKLIDIGLGSSTVRMRMEDEAETHLNIVPPSDIDRRPIFWDNGDSWVEFIPRDRLSGEDMFAIKLGIDLEELFGKRTHA